MVYEGTYGICSVALVITIAYSYAMEKNESLENVVMYVVVALAAFSAQLNLGTEDFATSARMISQGIWPNAQLLNKIMFRLSSDQW